MTTITLEDVLRVARQLTPEERRRLRDQLTVLVDSESTPVSRRRSSRGTLAHLGRVPSAEDIDEARRDVWTDFPRDDIS